MSIKRNCWRLVVYALLIFGGIQSQAAFVSTMPEHDEPRELSGFDFVDKAGNVVSMDQWTGKFVVLNIWATWCVSCREEMPMLDRLQARLSGDYFEVVALSIDKGGVDVVEEFFNELGIKHLEVYLDPSMISKDALNIFGLPTTLLIDPEGLEVGRLVGPAEWDSKEMISFFEHKILSLHKKG